MPEYNFLKSLKKDALEHAPFLVVLVVAAVACSWHVSWSLPEVYEEAMPVRIAYKFWNLKNAGARFDPGFFTYPAFIFYLNYAAECVVYLIGQATGTLPVFAVFVLLGRQITVLFSLATVVFTYRIGCRLAGKEAGLLASVLLAISPLLIGEAHLVNVDTPLMFFSVLTLWYSIRIMDSGELSAYIGAGIAAGLATASKYDGALVFALPLAAHLLREESVRNAVRSLVRPRVWISVLLGVFVFAATNPYIILRFSDFWSQFTDVQIHMDAGHLGVNPEESGYAYYLLNALPAGLGWLTALAGFVAFGFAVARRRKDDFLLWLFPVLVVGILGGWKMHTDRYFLPALPFFAIAAAAILVELWEKVVLTRIAEAFEGKALNPFVQTGIAVLACLLLIALPAKDVYAYHLSFSQPDTRLISREWIAHNIEPKHFIVVAPNGPDLPEAQNVIRLPFNALETERTAPFYDIRWYSDAQYFIMSDYDQGRYSADPVRYKEFLDFYAEVRQHSTQTFGIAPDEHRRGPAITVYRAFGDSTIDGFPDELIQRLGDVGNDDEVFLFCRKMGSIFCDLRKIGKAYPLLAIAVAIKPEDLSTRQVLSRVLCLAAKWDDAHKNMNEFIAANPDNVLAILYDGDIFANEGKMKEAEESYLYGLKLDSGSIPAFQKLGALYFRERDAAKLKPFLTHYRTLFDPNSVEAQIIGRQLADLATWKQTK
jgi:4-amino-4-deoxy-L-arabinose transferase-like glycosyltransferase